VVNGPEDEPTDWSLVNWRQVEGDVRRLRQRIFTASQAGDLAKVGNLQKLLLRSRANMLVSVRRVTERNAGRKTAGVDGKVVVGPASRAELADWMQHHATPGNPSPSSVCMYRRAMENSVRSEFPSSLTGRCRPWR
jgi:RNA-directed DNA polymerase